jgi:hypothetical protein
MATEEVEVLGYFPIDNGLPKVKKSPSSLWSFGCYGNFR